MQCSICKKEMSGVLDSDDITVCGSCVMAPLPSLEEEQNSELEDKDIYFSLDYLDDTPKTKERQRPKGRSTYQVQSTLAEATLKPPIPLQEVKIKTMKVKSNHLRDTAYTMESLILHFDGEGVAEVPKAYLEVVSRHMKARPGRFKILQDPKEAPKVKALEEAKAALQAARQEKAEEEEAKKALEEVDSSEEVEKVKPTKAKKTTKKKTTKKDSSKE